MADQQPRRQFMQNVGAASAGVMAAGYTATARGYAANETIHVGAIGTGGRCRQLLGTLGEIPGVKIVAVCDIWDDNLQKGRALADPKAATTKDYHELLARKDIDAVVIGTPDHWHVPITIDACKAGKDVYVEKPLTHDLSEGPPVIAAQNEYKRIVQVGMQQRSMPHLIEANKIIRSGELGEIRKVHLTWNRNSPRAQKKNYGIDPNSVDWKRFLGNAPQQPYDEYRFRHWRWFWDFGGGIFTDLMVHYVDVAHWFLGLDHPQMATSIGDHFMAKDVWQTPDTVQTLMRYPGQDLQVYFEGTFVNARNAAMMEYMGTNATLYCDRGRYEIHPEHNRKIKYRELVLGSGSRGKDFYETPNGRLLHLTNWLECIRTRKTPNAPAEAGVSAASAAHMANLALRGGKVQHWAET
ncbi:Inositol 2-dehydrogenase [Symmachiella dynata]|uniref:Inositol 2-dehydrogenase n=1 Tax=Symmachiella dynata TaxID=2527995 RepID=A0A517ZRZ3_9PLAN|nr:Gfo/Idh/MocA family oxidoreductase [Symmachiella dynata]QDU45248.1 Inositol 2-dehydrogenase [Symmachiella dynata]